MIESDDKIFDLGEHDTAVVFCDNGDIHVCIPPGHPSRRLTHDQNTPAARALIVMTLFDETNPYSDELLSLLSAAIDFEERSVETVH
tara:strand:+ start:3601 stop:3861 length:261 start_codon:yes stop_codon:yes gene_type:complete